MTTQEGGDGDDSAVALRDLDALLGDATEQSDSDEDSTLTSTYPTEDAPLVAVEECVPRLHLHDYMSALINTDPRAVFDAVHLGALVAIERTEDGLRGWSARTRGPDWRLPTVSLRRSPFALGGHRARHESNCFEVEGIHERIYRRAPLEKEKEEHLVDELLTHHGRSNVIREVLRPDLVLALRRSREKTDDQTQRPHRKRRRQDAHVLLWAGDGEEEKEGFLGALGDDD